MTTTSWWSATCLWTRPIISLWTRQDNLWRWPSPQPKYSRPRSVLKPPVVQLCPFSVHLYIPSVCLFPVKIHDSVKHLSQVCFTGLHNQQTTPAAVLQGRCCALLQGDQSQNALEHAERTAVHRWVCCSSTHKAKVVINYRMIFWPLAILL